MVKKFTCDRDITEVDGYETYFVLAEDEQEARKKFENGEGKYSGSNIDVTDLAKFDFGTMQYE